MFPSKLPTEEIRQLVSMVRNGEVGSHPAEAAKLGLWITGCSLETFFPTPDEDNPTPVFAVCPLDDVDECCKAIDELAPEQFGFTLDPELLAAIFRLVQLLMDR